MIPLLEKTLVEEKRWIQKEELANTLAIAQTAPGSLAVNSATYVGYRLAGIRGAILATLGIILPSFCLVVGLGGLFLQYQQHPLVRAAFRGMEPAIVALIIYAAVEMARTALLDKATIALCFSSIAGLMVFSLPPIVLLFLGVLMGLLLKKKGKSRKDPDPDYDLGAGI